MSRQELMKIYRSDLEALTERAKQPEPHAKGLNLGERFFVELLHFYIGLYRVRELTEEQLVQKKKELEVCMIDYWDQARMFREDVKIRNAMSPLLTRATKDGCEICRELVAVFEGRKKRIINT